MVSHPSVLPQKSSSHSVLWLMTRNVECATNNGGCLNGATCVDTAGSYTCACVSGWTGTSCGTDVNGATRPVPSKFCVSFVIFKVQLTSQRAALYCVLPACSECATLNGGCMNGGTCTNAAGSSACTCSSAWSGATCGLNVNGNQTLAARITPDPN